MGSSQQDLVLQAGVHRSGMNADCPVSGKRHENLLNAVARALPVLRRIARAAEVAEKFPICGVVIEEVSPPNLLPSSVHSKM